LYFIGKQINRLEMFYRRRSLSSYFLILSAMSASFCCREAVSDAHDHTHVRQEFHNDVFPTRFPDQIILNLTEDPLSSMAVNWRTSTEVSGGVVQFATATHGPEFREAVIQIEAETERFENRYENEPNIKAHFHSAMIDNLTPGEKYVYRVGLDTLWSEWLQFETPDPNNSALQFIYFGDAQNEVKSMWSRVVREAYGTMPKVDFLLHAGDLINRSARDVEWAEWFYAGSFIHAMVPSMMTPGNHEYKDVVLSPQWKPQFNLPTNGPAGLDETCYQINYPELKVISLDAEQIDESEELNLAQQLWLDSILTHDPRRWTVITLHYPFYSTKPNRDNPELRAAFKPIVDRHAVDLVLQGHDHAYGRGDVKNEATGINYRDEEVGTVYVVSVSGPKMYDVGDHDWMKRKAGQTQLFQVISILDDQLEYKAYTARAELYDSFQLTKVVGGPNQIKEFEVELQVRDNPL